MSGNQNTGGSKSQGNFWRGLKVLMGFMGAISWMGLRRVKFKSVEFQFLAPTGLLLLFALTFANYAHLTVAHAIWPGLFTPRVILFLKEYPRYWHFLGVVFLTGYWVLFCFGFFPFIKRQKFQKDLDTVGLSNSQGLPPKVVGVIPLEDEKTRLFVKAKGIGVEKFESRRGDLESSFEQIVEHIGISANRKAVEILLCKKALTKMLPFEEALPCLKTPYSFLVGESAGGMIVQDIRDLPHLLIAGSTGGGKSAFFRQALICLLRSSPHLQLYLLDLKRGVEVKEFATLPNVRIAKDEAEAVMILEAVREEMNKRFKLLEEQGSKKIDPKIHQRDLIVIGIDEASVLYSKSSGKSSKTTLTIKARELTDEIAKLARAAGIHLIIATQKAIKESIDTKILENLGGRMVFKMATHAGSNTALGNVRAYSLPDIKGRGIWAGGNKFIEVQAPFISEKSLESECKEILDRPSVGSQKNFQPMLEIKKAKSEKVSGFNKNTQSETGHEEG